MRAKLNCIFDEDKLRQYASIRAMLDYGHHELKLDYVFDEGQVRLCI